MVNEPLSYSGKQYYHRKKHATIFLMEKVFAGV